MSRLLLAAAVIAAVSASARAQGAACAANADLDAKSFALWIMPGTNPDEVPCAAMLAQKSCSRVDGADVRSFASADGRYSATYKISDDGAVTVALALSGAAGVGRSSTVLAIYPYQRALYRGIGYDGLQVFDEDAQQTKGIGNVMLIPADALTENGKAMCPAN